MNPTLSHDHERESARLLVALYFASLRGCASIVISIRWFFFMLSSVLLLAASMLGKACGDQLTTGDLTRDRSWRAWSIGNLCIANVDDCGHGCRGLAAR